LKQLELKAEQRFEAHVFAAGEETAWRESSDQLIKTSDQNHPG